MKSKNGEPPPKEQGTQTDEREDAADKVAAEAPNEDLLSDPDYYTLSQKFREEIGVKKVIVQVPVRKPKREEFIRVRDDEHYRRETALLELKEEREFYLLTPDIRDALPGEWYPVRLVTAINRLDVPFLWPLKLAGPHGQSNAWYDTAIEAANLAKQKWVRVLSDMSLGGYQPYVAEAKLPEPIWPEYNFQDLWNIAFRDRTIQSMDDPVIQRLLGRV